MFLRNFLNYFITLVVLIFSTNISIASPKIKSLLETEGIPEAYVDSAIEVLTIAKATETFFISKDYSLTYDAMTEKLWNNSYFKEHPLGEERSKKILSTRLTLLRNAALWFDKNPNASWEEVENAGFEALIPIKERYERSKRVRSAIAEFTTPDLSLGNKREDNGIFKQLDEEKLKETLYESMTAAELSILLDAFTFKYGSIIQSIYYLNLLLHVAPQAITDKEISELVNSLKTELPRVISIVKMVAEEEFNTYFIDEVTFIKDKFEPEAEVAWERGGVDGEYLKRVITSSKNQEEFNQLVLNGARNLVGAPGHLLETFIYGVVGGIAGIIDLSGQGDKGEIDPYPLSTMYHQHVTTNIRPIFEKYNPGGSVLGDDETFANLSTFEMGWNVNPTLKFIIEPIAPLGEPISKVIEYPRKLYQEAMQFYTNMSAQEYAQALDSGDWDIYWGDKLFQFGETLLSFGTIGKLKYSTKFLAAAAKLAPTAKTAATLNRLKNISQVKAMLPAGYASLAIGGFVSAGQEVWQSGEPGDDFNFRRFADNFTLQFSGSMKFMAGLSAIGSGVGFVGGNGPGALFLQRVLMKSTDVADGVSDFDETIKGLLRNSKNNQQYIGTLLVLVGNFIDTGDVSIPLSNLIENISQGSTGTFTPEDLQFVLTASSILGKERFSNLKQDQMEALVYANKIKEEDAKDAVLNVAGLSGEEKLLLLSKVSEKDFTFDQKLAEEVTNKTGKRGWEYATFLHRLGIELAHRVGEGEIGKDGINPAGKGNYTDDQLHRKQEILYVAGFSFEEIKALIEAGVVGKNRPEKTHNQTKRDLFPQPQIALTPDNPAAIKNISGERPWRRGGIRIARDSLSDSASGDDGVVIIHNYGHGGAGLTLSWGTVRRSIKLAEEALPGTSGSPTFASLTGDDKVEVVILGAGVIGLTTAYELRQQGFKGKITIYADKIATRDDDIVSNRIGGLISPVSVDLTAATPTEKTLIAEIQRESFREFEKLLGEDFGVYKMPIFVAEDPLYPGVDHSGMKEASELGLVPPPIHHNTIPVQGAKPIEVDEYVTYQVDTKHYLSKLLTFLESRNGQVTFVKERFETLDILKAKVREKHGDKNIVFNCTGLGSKDLFQDDNLAPVLGHLVLVKVPEGSETPKFLFFMGDYYLFPHPKTGEIALGGSFLSREDIGRLGPAVIEGTHAEIVKRINEIFYPENADNDSSAIPDDVGYKHYPAFDQQVVKEFAENPNSPKMDELLSVLLPWASDYIAGVASNARRFDLIQAARDHSVLVLYRALRAYPKKSDFTLEHLRRYLSKSFSKSFGAVVRAAAVERKRFQESDGHDYKGLPGVEDSTLDPISEAIKNENRALLFQAIHNLSDDRQRRLIVAYYFEGRSAQELARKEQVTAARIYQILQGARAKLHHQLKKLMEDRREKLLDEKARTVPRWRALLDQSEIPGRAAKSEIDKKLSRDDQETLYLLRKTVREMAGDSWVFKITPNDEKDFLDIHWYAADKVKDGKYPTEVLLEKRIVARNIFLQRGMSARLATQIANKLVVGKILGVNRSSDPSWILDDELNLDDIYRSSTLQDRIDDTLDWCVSNLSSQELSNLIESLAEGPSFEKAHIQARVYGFLLQLDARLKTLVSFDLEQALLKVQINSVLKNYKDGIRAKVKDGERLRIISLLSVNYRTYLVLMRMVEIDAGIDGESILERHFTPEDIADPEVAALYFIRVPEGEGTTQLSDDEIKDIVIPTVNGLLLLAFASREERYFIFDMIGRILSAYPNDVLLTRMLDRMRSIPERLKENGRSVELVIRSHEFASYFAKREDLPPPILLHSERAQQVSNEHHILEGVEVLVTFPAVVSTEAKALRDEIEEEILAKDEEFVDYYLDVLSKRIFGDLRDTVDFWYEVETEAGGVEANPLILETDYQDRDAKMFLPTDRALKTFKAKVLKLTAEMFDLLAEGRASPSLEFKIIRYFANSKQIVQMMQLKLGTTGGYRFWPQNYFDNFDSKVEALLENHPLKKLGFFHNVNDSVQDAANVLLLSSVESAAEFRDLVAPEYNKKRREMADILEKLDGAKEDMGYEKFNKLTKKELEEIIGTDHPSDGEHLSNG